MMNPVIDSAPDAALVMEKPDTPVLRAVTEAQRQPDPPDAPDSGECPDVAGFALP